MRADKPVHFRLRVRMDGFTLQGGSQKDLSFKVERPRRVSVRVDPTTEHEDVGRENSVVLVVECSMRPSVSIYEGFRALSERRVPDDVPDERRQLWRGLLEPDGRVLANHVLPRSVLPPRLDAFVLQMSRELWESARRVGRLLRWHRALGGTHNPFQQLGSGAGWSLDASEWYPMPSETSAHFIVNPIVRPSSGIEVELQQLLDAGWEEPVAHQLFLEAYHQRASNRRSALVVGVAALEVGVKACIGSIQPNAKWLVENMPSPPVQKLLLEYLPTIDTPNRINGQVLPPPAKVLEALKTGVTLRNRVAHATGEDVSRETLGQVLRAISDTLWLLDYYRGATWALAHISPEVRAELGLRPLEEPK